MGAIYKQGATRNNTTNGDTVMVGLMVEMLSPMKRHARFNMARS